MPEYLSVSPPPPKKCDSPIDAPHARQPWVNGEILVRYGVNAVRDVCRNHVSCKAQSAILSIKHAPTCNTQVCQDSPGNGKTWHVNVMHVLYSSCLEFLDGMYGIHSPSGPPNQRSASVAVC